MNAHRRIIAALSEDSLGGIATLQDVTDAEQLVDAHRAEVLAEGLTGAERQFLTFALDLAADRMANRGDEFDADDEAALKSLRRMADEAATEKATPTGEATPADLTVYRASHDSIVIGLYTTPTEARKHCEAEERHTWAKGTDLVFDWIEDEEDDVAELVTVTEDGKTETVTGYVVTPLTVASKYDEEDNA